jgi:uncharacterized Fe-S cluster-containing radical SAM superfamily enzyme
MRVIPCRECIEDALETLGEPEAFRHLVQSVAGTDARAGIPLVGIPSKSTVIALRMASATNGVASVRI